jgi:hypothetical protein
MSEETVATQATETVTQDAAAAPEAAVSTSATETAATTETAASEAAKPAGTILGSEAEEADTKPQANWPDDWRERIAGDDAKELARLKRYASFDNYAKAQRDLLTKVSSGEIKKALKADASPEEVAAWRKENGIPESPDKYDTGIGDGVVWGEADKPYLDKYLAHAHENNYDPAKVKADLVLYNRMQQEAATQQAEQDDSYREESNLKLMQELGGEYKRTINSVNNLLQTAPAGVADALLSARTADGRLLGNTPEVIMWLAQQARELNPMASLVPAGTADIAKGGAARITEIEGIMRSDPTRYWKTEPGLQDELMRLYEAREKMQGR